MGPKGYIRTLEAVIAIVLILLFIFTIIPERTVNPKAVPLQVKSSQKYILQSVANNPGLRTEALSINDNIDCSQVPGGQINAFVQQNLPPGFGYSCAVCISTSCVFTPDSVTTSVYMDDIMITPDNVIGGPKIVRLWFWAIQP